MLVLLARYLSQIMKTQVHRKLYKDKSAEAGAARPSTYFFCLMFC